jgi:hypothetical protein
MNDREILSLEQGPQLTQWSRVAQYLEMRQQRSAQAMDWDAVELGGSWCCGDDTHGMTAGPKLPGQVGHMQFDPAHTRQEMIDDQGNVQSTQVPRVRAGEGCLT